jgi:sec-independent protein translocase protein TatA
MNVFGIGLPEMAVIAAIALLVFGPKRLPELGKTLGRTLKGFQSASQGFEEQFRTALDTAPEPPPTAAATTTVSTSVVEPTSSAEVAPVEGTASGGSQAS